MGNGREGHKFSINELNSSVITIQFSAKIIIADYWREFFILSSTPEAKNSFPSTIAFSCASF